MRRILVFVWLLVCGLPAIHLRAASLPPNKVVEQFIESHLQGRFAEARSLVLERANVGTSLFGSWIFGPGGAGDAGTADIFLSRKFAQQFRYSVTGTNPTGQNQVQVTVMRSCPNLTHLYTWALVPKRGATPYELIDAVDTYIAKVNFPVEESRLLFTVIREVDSWYISAIEDDKFMQFQRQFQLPQPLAAASPQGTVAAAAPAGATPTPAGTNAAGDAGRQMADAQFYATLQGFNRNYQPGVAASGAAAPIPENKSFLGKVASLIGLEGKSETMVKVQDNSVRNAFNAIRDALGRYAAGHNSYVPDEGQIRDWQTLRTLVNRYGKRPLPTTEADAGFSFVRYKTDSARTDYTLVVEFHQIQDGAKQVEITPYGIDRVN